MLSINLPESQWITCVCFLSYEESQSIPVGAKLSIRVTLDYQDILYSTNLRIPFL